MTPSNKRQRPGFIYTEREKMAKYIYKYMKKYRHFTKSKIIYVTFLFTKI